MLSYTDFNNLLPYILLASGILISVVIEIYAKKSEEILSWFSAFLFLLVAGTSIFLLDRTSFIFNGSMETGGYVNLFIFIFNIGAFILSLLSKDYIKKYGTVYGEYYILIQISVLGMMFMASARDLLMVFMGLEVMSIPFYVLAGINRKRLLANEASLKYFLLGAFASGFVVYGIALVYGAVGSTAFADIHEQLDQLFSNVLFVAGLLLIVIGFSFKIAAFPFHMWVPDVYQGSSTTIAGLFSTGGKAAAFATLVFTLGAFTLDTKNNSFIPYLAVISVASMFYGSIVAIAQNDIKRMLAYSSISHAGYIIIGLASANTDGISGIVFYLAAYTFMNLGAFGIISLIEGPDEKYLKLTSYNGLSNKRPVLAALLALCMFSLAGLPPFAGFFAKYYIFISAVRADLTWLAILGVISSAISVYFYIRVVVLMYFKESEEEVTFIDSKTGMAGVIISVIFTILLGVLPNSFLDLFR